MSYGLLQLSRISRGFKRPKQPFNFVMRPERAPARGEFMRIRKASLGLSLLTVVSLMAAGPAATVREARDLIASRKFAEAATLLERTMPEVSAIANPADRARGQAAIHFYSAAAQSGLQNEERAREHLDEFFRLQPGARIDAAKYDPRFVALFERIRTEAAGNERFASLYPGFSPQTPLAAPLPAADSAALELLGSSREKREWRDIGSDDARREFFGRFWQRRDPTPQTSDNEFRETFVRRVAFADSAFGKRGEQGSLTDRGRVFTILGEPAVVRRRAVTSNDPIQAFNVGSVGIAEGTIEYWFYSREQLPSSHAKPTVTFRFVSHQGIGDFVLQKDGLAINALNAAARAGERE